MELAQKAVWTCTNGHCINTIYDPGNTNMFEDFARYVASLTHERLPGYFINYKLDIAPGHRIIATEKTKIFVTMHWATDDGYRHMHLVVYRENGTIYKTIGADQVIDKIGYTVNVEFDPKRDPAGVYMVTLYDDANKIWDSKKVIIGARSCDLMS
jgi:hypothetical protein